jgi:hypothetical protein
MKVYILAERRITRGEKETNPSGRKQASRLAEGLDKLFGLEHPLLPRLALALQHARPQLFHSPIPIDHLLLLLSLHGAQLRVRESIRRFLGWSLGAFRGLVLD